jgi:hypothetical protein
VNCAPRWPHLEIKRLALCYHISVKCLSQAWGEVRRHNFLVTAVTAYWGKFSIENHSCEQFIGIFMQLGNGCLPTERVRRGTHNI